jgi:hypothetical protein
LNEGSAGQPAERRKGNMISSIEIGTTVKRIASDYTNGRTGRVIEMDGMKPRARVSWEKDAHGNPMKLRTWVRLTDLQTV